MPITSWEHIFIPSYLLLPLIHHAYNSFEKGTIFVTKLSANRECQLSSVNCVFICRWNSAEACCHLSKRRWPVMRPGFCMRIHFSATWSRRCCCLRKSYAATSHIQQCCLVFFISCLRTQSFRNGSLWKRRVSFQVKEYLHNWQLTLVRFPFFRCFV